MGGVLELTGYPIYSSGLITMVTVSWLTSILALFMFWFSRWFESVKLVTRFPDPAEPAPTNLVYAGSRA